MKVKPVVVITILALVALVALVILTYAQNESYVGEIQVDIPGYDQPCGKSYTYPCRGTVVVAKYDPNGNGQNIYEREEVSCVPMKDANGHYLQAPQNNRCRLSSYDDAPTAELTRTWPKDLKNPFPPVLLSDGKPDGDACKQNQQCASGMCGLQNHDSDLTCCRSDQTSYIGWDFRTHCTPNDNIGDYCEHDSDCRPKPGDRKAKVCVGRQCTWAPDRNQSTDTNLGGFGPMGGL